MRAVAVNVQGIVQGVGFRPNVYRLAKRHSIFGWVYNHNRGVTIFAQGEDVLVDEFLVAISDEKPPASRIDFIEISDVPIENVRDFEIRKSVQGATAKTEISPDLATCDKCLSELFDPRDRRYHYPFINCTDCGPRFTIIEDLPYDRARTSMKVFEMCVPCLYEYENPDDRRYHAQPNACFDCGPELSLFPERDEIRNSDAIIRAVATELSNGKIAAIKGLGGYHFACDAQNEEAVQLLRKRKNRYKKPLAVMFSSISEAAGHCRINPAEEELLLSPAHPIVLLELKGHACHRRNLGLAPSITEGLRELGVMLPYTPMQHLLLKECGIPLVMTSGNISEEPIISDDEEALSKLGGIADIFLTYNRRIVSKYDDSVLRVVNGKAQFIRRARGYAPRSIALKGTQATTLSTAILAVGSQQKNTFTLFRDEKAIVSQHIGDLENFDSYETWEKTILHYNRMFDFIPQIIACDKHPEYLSTKWARDFAQRNDLPLIEVQHHHAHIAAVMAENGISSIAEEVIGIAFDGTGYGEDGTIWGGEILTCSLSSFKRYAHLQNFPMPGGEAAIKHPARMAFSLLHTLGLKDHSATAALRRELGEQIPILENMIATSTNSPLTSSAGRLFDVVAALLGLAHSASYDGEAPAMLEALLYDTEDNHPIFDDGLHGVGKYKFKLESGVVTVAPVIRAILDDIEVGVSSTIISRRFHDGVLVCITDVCESARKATGLNKVALSGGVFMNRYISSNIRNSLEDIGFEVLEHRELPPNDACISYGQAAVANAKAKGEKNVSSSARKN